MQVQITYTEEVRHKVRDAYAVCGLTVEEPWFGPTFEDAASCSGKCSGLSGPSEPYDLMGMFRVTLLDGTTYYYPMASIARIKIT